MDTFLIPVFGNLETGINPVDLFCNREIKRDKVLQISVNNVSVRFPASIVNYDAIWEVQCNYCKNLVPETRLMIESQYCMDKNVPMAIFRIQKTGDTFNYSCTNFQPVTNCENHLKLKVIDVFTQHEVVMNLDIYFIVAVKVCQ